MFPQQLANVQNPVAGGICTVLIPPGPTYDEIGLRFAGATATKARVQNIKLKINGKVVQEWLDLADLDDRNTYHGGDAMPATPIDVILPLRQQQVQAMGQASTIDAERMTSLRTGDLGTVSVEFKLDAAYVDASAANVTAYANVKPGAPEPMGLTVMTRRNSYNAGGAGKFVIQDIPKAGRVIAHHIIKNDVTEVTCKLGRVAVVDGAQKTALQDTQDYNGRVPAAARTVVDYCVNGNADEALDIRGSLDYELTLTLGSGGAFDILTEYLAGKADL